MKDDATKIYSLYYEVVADDCYGDLKTIYLDTLKEVKEFLKKRPFELAYVYEVRRLDTSQLRNGD